jgi:osmotically-inducible protein OsmY
MPRAPRTYDEIVRRTVPDVDTSIRPSPEQIERAQDDFIRRQVADILIEHGAANVGYEVDRKRVALRGTVPSEQVAARIRREVAALNDVEHVDDHMHILH